MKFKVLSRGGYRDHSGKNWDKGQLLETEDNLAAKFPGVFEPVFEQTAVAEKVVPKAAAKVEVADEPETDESWTDATDAFAGAAEAGATVFQKDDGTFVVRGLEDEDVELETADEVTGLFEEKTTATKPKAKKGKAK